MRVFLLTECPGLSGAFFCSDEHRVVCSDEHRVRAEANCASYTWSMIQSAPVATLSRLAVINGACGLATRLELDNAAIEIRVPAPKPLESN